jgi:hypothetical protein
MSKAFRNQISTLAALEGFIDMLVDLIKEDKVSSKHPELETGLKLSLLNIKTLSREAQVHCKGNQITLKEYKQIEKAIKDSTALFQSGDNPLFNIVSYISFALIGFDSVVNRLKGVKSKLRNTNKINSFEKLATASFQLLQLFDPDLESINDYVKASLAREQWEVIFET